MTSTLDDIRRQWLPEIERRIAVVGPGSGLVAKMCRYHLSTGGKRIRAILPIWVCTHFGGRPEDALEFGLALELLHNATLIHDDIQDGDTLRRGQPTVWSRWGAPQAINAGDALIFQAMRHLALAPSAPHVLPLVCERMGDLIEGQALDLQLHLPETGSCATVPLLADWIEAARRKTGALFALCFQLGVCAAGAEAQWQIHAAEFGYLVGLAFQVTDDLLEFTAEKGRAPAGDLMIGKMSFPVLWAYEHANASDIAVLDRVMRNGRQATTPEMVRDALHVLQKCGALDATREWMSKKKDECLRSSMANIVPEMVREAIGALGEQTQYESPSFVQASTIH